MNKMDFNKAYNCHEFINFLQNSFLPESIIPVFETVTLPTKMKYTSEIIKLDASEALELMAYHHYGLTYEEVLIVRNSHN